MDKEFVCYILIFKAAIRQSPGKILSNIRKKLPHIKPGLGEETIKVCRHYNTDTHKNTNKCYSSFEKRFNLIY